MYCGDETGAFVGDVSSFSSCFGYGGEDCPKVVLPSYMYQDKTIPNSLHNLRTSCGTRTDHAITTTTTTTNSSSNNNDMEQNLKNNNDIMEEDILPIFSPYPTGKDALNPDCYLENDGLIQNYDAYENVWNRAFHDLNVRLQGKHFRGSGMNSATGSSSSNSSGGTAAVAATSSSRIGTATNYNDSLLDDQPLIHPLLAIDSGNTNFHNRSLESTEYVKKKQRSKMLEILFESLSAPAVFIAPSPMLSSFAFGRQTSLIVDIGARGTRVTPIVDGLVLENAQRRSGRGGEYLNAVQCHVLDTYIATKKKNKSDYSNQQYDGLFVHPRYACQKNGLTNNNGINVHYPNNTIQHSIFHDFAVRDVMYEMKTSPHITGVDLYRDEKWTVPFLNNISSDATAQTISPGGEQKTDVESMEVDNVQAHEQEANNVSDDDDKDDPNEDYDLRSKRVYTLPDGTKIKLENKTGKDLCRIAELFFAEDLPFKSNNLDSPIIQQSQPTFSSLPIHQLIKSSLSAVGDADVRKELCGNIILTGASSLFPNMEQRLSLEVSHLVPNMYRCKVICSRNTLERRYSPWIGGSVLTSLGSFQQLWLSKTEYDEYGAMLATQRFP